MVTHNLELRLHEERAKYLVCELTCPLEGATRSGYFLGPLKVYLGVTTWYGQSVKDVE